MSRKEVYIANILKCRPPDNRNPKPEEVNNCTPFLHKQLELIQPRCIVALGTYAAHFLAGNKTPISKMRGTFFSYRDIPVMPTFHPAYLCRNYSKDNRKLVWEDIQLVLKKVKE
jgi:uracil-DNA glycosylase